MNIKDIIISILLVFGCGYAFAQSNIVKGTIKDTDEQPIVATVVSLTTNDSTIISYAVTNNE